MNRFLIYLSERRVGEPRVRNAINEALHRIGSVSLADPNVFVVETERGIAAVQESIEASSPARGVYLVASVEEMASGGDDPQFRSALLRLEE